MNLSQLLLPIVFLGGPLLALALQLRAYARDHRLRQTGRRSTAELLARGTTVEQLEGQEYLETSKTRRTTTLCFPVEDGRLLTFEEDLGGAAEAVPLGGALPVFYDPRDPSRHVVGQGVRLHHVFVTALIGLPFLLAGLFVALG